MISLFLLLFLQVSAFAQLVVNDPIPGYMAGQLSLFPQEKIHLHIDKPVYVSGEIIWLKAYLVNASNHTPQHDSRYVYVELSNPTGELISRVKIRNQDGIYSGHIQLPENLSQGNYPLRAYTNYMRNLDEEYFYKGSVQVLNPQSRSMEAFVSFDYPTSGHIEATLEFRGSGGTHYDIDRDYLDLKYNNNTIRALNVEDVKRAVFNIRPGERDVSRMLYVGYRGYSRYFDVPYPDYDYELDFFPEGGNIVVGIPSCVAFKALKPDGSPIAVTGEVRDAYQRIIATFSTIHEGMGYFEITPVEGMQYHVECTGANGAVKRFRLPVADPAATSLKVEKSGDRLYISALRGPRAYAGPLNVVIHTRGVVAYSGELASGTNSNAYGGNSTVSGASSITSQITSSIPGPITGSITGSITGPMVFGTTYMPSGVMHILLTDSHNNTLSERLVYVENDDQAVLSLVADKDVYTTRDRIRLDLALAYIGSAGSTGRNDSTGIADISVSVTDDADVDASKAVSIHADLLLASDLRGHIADPDHYFDKSNDNRAAELDVLMMTHGWRRYDVPEVLLGHYRRPSEPIEGGTYFSGRVLNLGFLRRPMAGANVSILALSQGYADITVADSLGRFEFTGGEYPEATEYIIQALTPKNKDMAELVLDKMSYPSVSRSLFPDHSGSLINYNYIAKSDERYTLENGMRNIDIDPVFVRAPKPTSNGYAAMSADHSYPLAEIERTDPSSVMDFVAKRVAGVMVVDNIPISSRSKMVMAIFVDGIYQPYDPYAPSGHMINFFPIDMIESIDVFTSLASAAVFGKRGQGGVISVTTKRGDATIPDRYLLNIKRIKPLGYQLPKEFYSPKYDTPQERARERRDLRTTIFWKPDLVMDSDGKASVEFYSADYTGSYTIIVEGITSDGRIVNHIEKVSVER